MKWIVELSLKKGVVRLYTNRRSAAAKAARALAQRYKVPARYLHKSGVVQEQF